MATRNDQVFQLSLTEIAFTVAFILLLLLGYVVFKEQSDRIAAQAALSEAEAAGKGANALRVAKATLAADLKGAGVANPDEVISRLVSANDVRAERDQLKKQVEDLDARLSALSELQSELERTAKDKRSEITKREIDRAISFKEQVTKMLEREGPKAAVVPPPQNKVPSKIAEERESELLTQVRKDINLANELKTQLKRQLKKDLTQENEVQAMLNAIEAAAKYAELAKDGVSIDVTRKENSDLRGQVAFLKNRLDARGGRDYPPCWADENGKVEFLFSVELGRDSVSVTPAWPSRRDTIAREIPGVKGAIEGSHSYPQFLAAMQPILDWSKNQDPECRHYVQLRSSISDAVQSDRARLMVESFFYKVEARR